MLAAVAVTMVRLLLPDIGIYKSEVEAWGSKYMGLPVVFHSIEFYWQGWVPELTLTDIELLNKAETEVITHFDKARISIAPLATVIERQFIPKSLVISGFELSIIRHETGSISIQDYNINDLNNNRTDDNELAEWLFKQDEIEIQNVKIKWTDIKYQQEEPILLTNVSFKMRNDVGRLQIEGSANLPENYGNKMDFAFDAYGDLLSSEWSGELYLSANEINPDNWYRNIRPLEFNLTGGKANIEVWMNWEQARMSGLQGSIQYEDFNALVQDETALSLNSITARFKGDKTIKDGWKFAVELDNFNTENGDWPDSDIIILREPTGEPGQYQFAVSFSYLKLDDLAPLMSKVSFLPEQARDFLTKINIDGELYDGTLQFDPSLPTGEQFTFETHFDNLTSDLGEGLPSFSNLTGHIKGSPFKGMLNLRDSKATFIMPDDNDQEIEITDLTGNLLWTKSEDSWTLKSDEIHISTTDLAANLAGSIIKVSGKPHFLDLVLDLDETELEKISDYIPETPTFKLRSWMRKALLGGTVSSASALFRGYTKDFPFDGNEGRFQVIADISDATFEYSQNWPLADQLYGNIDIEGRKLKATIQTGKFYGAEVSIAHASIPDILDKEKTVNLEGRLRGDINDLSLFIDQSPLHNHLTLAEIRNALQSGEFGLDLELGIPIKQYNKKPDVEGRIRFIDTMVNSPAMKIQVDNINGNVSFNKESVSSDILTGEFLGDPVNISISGDKTEDSSNPYIISIDGKGNEHFLVNRLTDYVPETSEIREQLFERISGTAEWKLQLAYVQDEKNNLEKHIEISSDLKGMEIGFPEPVGKRKFSTTPVKISTVLSKSAVQDIKLSFNSDILCNLQLNKNTEKKLQLARIFIGKQPEVTESKRKFLISGRLNNLSVRDWITFLGQISNGNESTHPVLNDIELDLDIAYLDLFDHEYFDVTTIGSKTAWGWSFNLDDDEIKGDVYLPKTPSGDRQLTLMLDKLYINENKNKYKENHAIDPEQIPLISVEINDLKHKGNDMGKFVLQSSKIYNGSSIDRFEIEKDSVHIAGNGTWLADGGTQHSKFKIDLHAESMSSMLETFGYDLTSIKDGETDFHIIADWKGSPWDLSLENLNGRLDMQITNGRLLDINPSAGRLFGLLSFHTLPRRLLLDFRDLFSKGMSFDKIAGSFDVANGNAYTSNLFMNSPSADVAITGRTGLAEKDYDQIVTVMPQVTESMPVAGAIFGPVGIGVGAAIYLVGELFTSLNNDIDNLLKYQYTITGSWDDPVIKKIKDNDVIAGG